MPPTSQNTQSFEIGTRKSQLALLQTEIVVKALKEAWPEYQFNVRPRDTAAGDLDKVTPFKDMPVKNLWTHDLEQSLVEEKLDLLVHSLKDVPTQLPADCGLGAILDREDPRDALVLKTCRTKCGLADLPAGSVVGTSSIRRAAQIALRHPHLRVQDVRGNVPTRLKKLDEDDGPFDALILAAAGLIRLDLGHRISEFLTSKNGGMLYAVGQGAIGIESRAKDVQMSQILEKINNNSTSFACLAERSLLRTLEGGCSAPVGVETEWITGCEEGPKLVMRAIVVSVNGKESVEIEMEEHIMTAESADSFGIKVANALVAKGADKILDAIKAKKRTEVVDLRE
ncbi:hypothetical protein EPUS_00560 [Endocarpon pusillum Z07020]|uniref:Porphobilinogen deaminase n=1 Tax=Endocarpon pusillum (strain Z07020 / HMAS-L-300199) TaxID=1263415 RepID=U1GID7_ENDPU|nr:uncharacterized protein EPUS_00560 [Endocarpon pusillum Z07020]ERF71571.1 hypothetical protein EPUS_00560 [Endocarpon pusillum Z07020]